MANILTEGEDFLQNKLEMKDLVAFTQGEKNFLSLGRVIGFTPKMVRVEIIPLAGTQTRIGNFVEGSKARVCTRFPKQLIKIPNNEEFFKEMPTSWLVKLFERE